MRKWRQRQRIFCRSKGCPRHSVKERSRFGLCGISIWRCVGNTRSSVRRGEILGVIGLSGAGKSTLVRCLNLLERPTEGKVFFDGQDLTALKGRELLQVRRSIGMIFQQFNLLMQRNALKNICFPLELAGESRQAAEKRARELLEIVGLADRAQAYPAQLSGGQKQRVAIARALATNPKVLCVMKLPVPWILLPPDQF